MIGTLLQRQSFAAQLLAGGETIQAAYAVCPVFFIGTLQQILSHGAFGTRDRALGSVKTENR